MLKFILLNGIAILLTGCLSVSPLYKQQLKKEDFAAISNKLLQLKNQHVMDSVILTKEIPDAELKNRLEKLKIYRVSINGNEQYLLDRRSDSLIFFEHADKNLSIRINNLEKGTTIIYDYSILGSRDLTSNREQWVSPTKRIKNRLYAYKYKEPGVR